MARVFRQRDATPLGLPGRTSLEIVSGRNGARGVTLRLVSIPVAQPGEHPRTPHQHQGVEECIFVLSGRGTTEAASGQYPLEPGDTILLPPGEHHATRNTGSEPLLLLCFYPCADVAAVTGEPDSSS
jgi:mannose-6-phosphate isomerase-like protein (cupin superfamily)